MKQKLPKRNPHEDLEVLSMNNLLHIFDLDHFTIRHIDKHDKGVDAKIELKSPEHHLGIEFQVQMKALHKGKGKRYYSKSIPTSNIEYLLNNSQSALYILYVKEEDNYYFDWVEDFARRLAEKDPDWEEQGSHTLRFVNRISESVVGEIYRRILDEGEATRREKDFVINGEIQPVYNSMHDIKSENVLDSFEKLFEVFSGISVIPQHVIEQIPPFAVSRNSQSYYSEAGSTLYTDNEALIKMFGALQRKRNKIILRPDSGPSAASKNQKLLRNILIFFNRNSIHHLAFNPNKGESERICVHDLYIYGSCECERCRLNRGDFYGAASKVESASPKTPYERLRNAFVHLRLGNFKKAFDLYRELIRHFRRQKNYVSCFMCKYALVRAYGLFRLYYFGSDRASALRFIKSINLEEEISLLQRRKLLKDEPILVLRWISQGNFIHYAHHAIDEKMLEIDTTYRNDKGGGWTSADLSKPLYGSLRHAIEFIEANLIHGEVLTGFGTYVHKVFECMLSVLNYHNENNTMLPGFDYEILRALVMYGSSERLEDLLSKYRTNLLPLYGREAEPKQNEISFMRLVDNVIGSLERLDSFIKTEDKHPNHFLSRKVNSVLKNLCVFISVLELPTSYVKLIFERLLNLFKTVKFIEQGTTSYLFNIIQRRHRELSLQLVEEFFILSLTHEKFDNWHIRDWLLKLFRNEYSNATFNPRIGELISSEIDRSDSKIEFNEFVHYYPLATVESRLKVENYVNDHLKKRFDFEDYYYAAINEIIPVESFWNVAIEAIPITQREEENAKYFGARKRNRRLNLLADLVFKFRLKLPSNQIQKILPSDPYFQWLFGLRNFEYSKFNPMWLLEFYSDHYFDEFKKHPKIVIALKKAVLETKASLLVDIYVKHFA